MIRQQETGEPAASGFPIPTTRTAKETAPCRLPSIRLNKRIASTSRLLWLMAIGFVGWSGTACVQTSQVRSQSTRAHTPQALAAKAAAIVAKHQGAKAATTLPQAHTLAKPTKQAPPTHKHAQHDEVPTHQIPQGMQPFWVGPAYKQAAIPALPSKVKVATATPASPGPQTPQKLKPKPTWRAKQRRKRRLARRSKRKRRRYRRGRYSFTAKRIIRWQNLMNSIESAQQHYRAKDVRRIYRSVRWKYRRALRQYRGMPGALKRDIRRFLSKLQKLRRQLLAQRNHKRRRGKRYRSILFQQRQKQAKQQSRLHQACRLRLPQSPKTKKSLHCPPTDKATQKQYTARHKARRVRASARFYWPTTSRYIASSFGWRKGPFSGRRGFHSGLDIAATYESPVFAAASGVVTKSGWNGGCGLTIFIQHKGGLRTGYCHLGRILTKIGKRVKAGQLIGKAGSTGSATAPHLHFTVRRRGRYINPLPFLRGRKRRKRRKRRKQRKRRKAPKGTNKTRAFAS